MINGNKINHINIYNYNNIYDEIYNIINFIDKYYTLGANIIHTNNDGFHVWEIKNHKKWFDLDEHLFVFNDADIRHNICHDFLNDKINWFQAKNQLDKVHNMKAFW